MKKFSLHVISICICLSIFTACSVQSKQADREETIPNNSIAASANQLENADENKSNMTANNIHFPLEEERKDLEKLTELEEHNITIYNDAEGQYVITINDLHYAFNWTGLTPRGILPRISYEDFDQDGVRELAVLLYTGAGTGISIEELHMLEVNADGSLTDFMYESEQYIDALQNQLSIELNQQEQALLGEITYNDQQVAVNLTNLLDENYGEVGKSLTYGNIVYFSVEKQQLLGSFKANVTVANWATPIVVGEVHATIHYANEAFTLHIDSFTAEQHIE